jgi:putative hemolysin
VWIEILIVLGLILANGLFAGAEIALLATRQSRLEELAGPGRTGSRALAALALRARPERLLATVQVGITVVGATAAAVSGASLADDLARMIAVVLGPGRLARDLALAIVIVAYSFLSIVLGELVPKSLALRARERYALLAARPLRALAWLAQPLIWLLTAVSNLLLRPFGDRTTFTETRYSSEELRQLVKDAASKGEVHPNVGEIASRALDLAALTAVDFMVPRSEVVSVARDASREEVRRIVREHRHTRMPVCGAGREDVVGYVSVKELFARGTETEVTLDEVMRPAYFVPETMPATTLLDEMRGRRQPFAIVVDEQGVMSGIVTLEDLLEELVGEIVSEHHGRPPAPIEREPGGSALVWGRVPVREVNRVLDLELPEEGDWTTIAGLCNALATHIATSGERLQAPHGEILEIIEATPRQVQRIRVHPRPAA